MSNDLVETLPGGDLVAAGETMRRVQTTYATAIQVQKPRVLARVQKSILEEANLAGETFFYGWGAGKDKIEGPSQELAHALARCWGNCALEFAPVQETAEAWIFTAYF